MKIVTRLIPIAALLAAAVSPAAAQAQAYAPPPLYPYAVQPGQPYAVEVAPGRYVIHRPGERYAHRRAFDRRSVHNDPALVEQLRRRGVKKVRRDVINTTRIVREKPIVIEHQRVVEDPPRIIVRRHYVEDQPNPRRRRATLESEVASPPGRAGKARIIRAEAEVTILGPDRMTIRLFRQRAVNARAEAPKKHTSKAK